MPYKKWLYGLLVVSLATNLFFAGMLTVFLIKGGPQGGLLVTPPDRLNMLGARELLTPESQEIVDDIWRQFHSEQRDGFGEMFKLRNRLKGILLADEFDADAFRKTFAETEQKGLDLRLNLENVLGEIAAALPPGERKKYFEAMLENRGRGPMPGRGFEERRPPPDQGDGG